MTVPVLMTAAALASNPPPLPGFLDALSSPLQHFGVWAIALLIMVEDFGIPVPGETILIAGAVYAGAGRLNVVAVGVAAFIAAISATTSASPSGTSVAAPWPCGGASTCS